MVIVGVASVYLALLGWAMGHTSFNVWGGLVVAPVLVGLTLPLALAAARADATMWSARMVLVACVLKLVGAIVRYYVTFSLYGSGDAEGYHAMGAKLAPLFRQGEFTVDLGRRVAGTGFVEIVTGVVYTFTGATKLGGFFVFSWLGFVGLFLFWRAFRVAVPDGDWKRYALLVFLLPSLVFWPSSIGKESWMMLVIGLISYGVARMLAGRHFGLPILALGLLGAAMVRPHIALIAILSLFAAYFLRRSPRPTLLGPAAKIVVLAILAVGTLAVMSQMESFFGVKTIDTQSADQILAKTTQQSSQGGSKIQVTRPTSPIDSAQAAVAVLFRPWPYEASNVQTAVASLEGAFLLGLLVLSYRRLLSIPRAMFRRPYVAYALLYTLIFSYAFSAIGNFGILSRERVQVYPLLLVLVCIPVGFGSRDDATERAPDSVEPASLAPSEPTV